VRVVWKIVGRSPEPVLKAAFAETQKMRVPVGSRSDAKC
jgi:hypothetical protein